MVDLNLKDYTNLYLESAVNYLKQINLCIAKISQDPEDQAAIAEIHRDIHSLKSSSYFMNYLSLAAVCSAFENIFYKVKNGEIKISKSLLSLLMKIELDLKNTITSIKNTGQEVNLTKELRNIEEITGVKSSIKV